MKRLKLLILVLALCLISLPLPVFAEKDLFYAANPTTIHTATGGELYTMASGYGHQMMSGAGYVKSITISGIDTAAGDYAMIYDYTSANATYLKFEPSVGTAKETVTIQLNGAFFENGLFATANTSKVILTVEYYQ